MTIKQQLKKLNLSIYACAKRSGIPYSTLNDIVNGKTLIENCAASIAVKLAHTLNLTVEELLIRFSSKVGQLEYRPDFSLFKSHVCHDVRREGNLDFIIKTLDSNSIHLYWERGWFAEAFYLLAMVDYLSRISDIPPCSDFDEIRGYKLARPLYPRGAVLTDLISPQLSKKEVCLKDTIPEFMRFNIVEGDVHNVC